MIKTNYDRAKEPTTNQTLQGVQIEQFQQQVQPIQEQRNRSQTELYILIGATFIFDLIIVQKRWTQRHLSP